MLLDKIWAILSSTLQGGKMVAKNNAKANKKKTGGKEKVSINLIYQEIYQEMRRLRDYEINSSSWYTAILVAMLGFVVTIKYGDGTFDSELKSLLDTSVFVQCLFALVITFLGWSSACSVRYVSMRYHELKNYLFDKRHVDLLSALNWAEFRPIERVVEPVNLIYLTHFMILAISNSIIFMPNGFAGIAISLSVLSILFGSIFFVFFPASNETRRRT